MKKPTKKAEKAYKKFQEFIDLEAEKMREILFRGQTRKYGEKVKMGDGKKLPGRWVYGGVLQGAGSHSIIYGSENVNNPGENLDKWCVHTDTLGQFTGLTDKNGKRIFEGDIVKHWNGITFDIGRVFWDANYCGWRRTTVGAFHMKITETYRMSGKCDYEVIGNIHDNPELLENP